MNPDATSFAYLIKAHCTLRDFPAVTAVLERMKQLKLEPTQRTYAIILDLLSDLNEFEKGESMQRFVLITLFFFSSRSS